MKSFGVILAGGEGKRFKYKKGKIFFKLHGKRLIDYAIDKINKMKLNCVVIANKKNKDQIKRKDCEIIIQKKPLGTGNAIMTFLNNYKQFKKCLVINADTPFVHIEDIKRLIKSLKNVNISLLCYENKKNISDGVIIVKKNNFIIKEFKFLNKDEKKLKMCNSGVMVFDRKIAKQFLNIKRNIFKKEYLITDIFKVIKNKNYKTKIVQAKYPNLCHGINTPKESRKVLKLININ